MVTLATCDDSACVQLPATGSYVMVKALPLTACGVKNARKNSTVCAGSIMAHEGEPRTAEQRVQEYKYSFQ